jgi:two-component system response regulator AtoC
LVVDDELGTRESLRAIFKPRYEVTTASGATEAQRVLGARHVDLIFMDVIMPEQNGVDLLRDVQGRYPNIPVIMLSASHAVRPVVEAMRVGAFDFVTKPFDADEVQRLAERAIQGSALKRRVESLQTDLLREYPVEGVVGESKAFRSALDDLRMAAESDATVLLHGESGTGKELAARMLHAWSDRVDEPFVAVHCAALPEGLMESELFGHEKGAFTGADRQKLGRFDLAGSGTLFFDEVGEMPLATQVKLLRVLQEREFMRVGGTQVIRTDARIVAASGRDLRESVRDGSFREDLFYRLSVIPVGLPALRDRTGDVALLATYFLRHFAGQMDATCHGFSDDAMAALCGYRWPGNVRELRNIVERMLVLHGRRDQICAAMLPEEFQSGVVVSDAGLSSSLEEGVRARERVLIEAALRQSGGNQTQAAELLKTTRRKLKYRMDKLGLA